MDKSNKPSQQTYPHHDNPILPDKDFYANTNQHEDAAVTDIDLVKKSEANLNAILNHADSGYALFGSNLRVIAFNALAQTLTGLLYSKRLEIGTFLLDYFPAERHCLLLDIAHRVLMGENISYELCFQVADEEKWIEVGWLNVKNAENKNWGVILASKDITGRKIAANELIKITNDLQRRNKALEQFANITSHNLRAPVANIVNLVQMLDEVETETERRELLSFIQLSSQNLTQVITDIHQILEMKQHLQDLKEKIYFKQLVDSIEVSISSMVMKEHVSFRYDFSGAEYVHSTRSSIYGIFYNLILNSIKYRRPEADPEIFIKAAREKNNLVLTFADNGRGIDLKKHGALLFGLYKRFDTSVDGTGLGLYMVKSQIEELGGTIHVESELGKGTTFSISLPFSADNETDSQNNSKGIN